MEIPSNFRPIAEAGVSALPHIAEERCLLGVDPTFLEYFEYVVDYVILVNVLRNLPRRTGKYIFPERIQHRQSGGDYTVLRASAGTHRRRRRRLLRLLRRQLSVQTCRAMHESKDLINPREMPFSMRFLRLERRDWRRHLPFRREELAAGF